MYLMKKRPTTRAMFVTRAPREHGAGLITFIPLFVLIYSFMRASRASSRLLLPVRWCMRVSYCCTPYCVIVFAVSLSILFPASQNYRCTLWRHCFSCSTLFWLWIYLEFMWNFKVTCIIVGVYEVFNGVFTKLICEYGSLFYLYVFKSLIRIGFLFSFETSRICMINYKTTNTKFLWKLLVSWVVG